MSSWNVTSEERLLTFPCDKYKIDEDVSLFRGVTVGAPPQVVFRWLCQLRVAPYSYDVLDNRGRKSPETLTPGMEKLEVGLKMMGFELIEYEQDRSITLKGKDTVYGDGVGSYMIVPQTDNRSRLLAKIRVSYPGLRGSFLRLLLPLGDMVMIRRQLLNLKKLSEQTYWLILTGAGVSE